MHLAVRISLELFVCVWTMILAQSRFGRDTDRAEHLNAFMGVFENSANVIDCLMFNFEWCLDSVVPGQRGSNAEILLSSTHRERRGVIWSSLSTVAKTPPHSSACRRFSEESAEQVMSRYAWGFGQVTERPLGAAILLLKMHPPIWRRGKYKYRSSRAGFISGPA